MLDFAATDTLRLVKDGDNVSSLRIVNDSVVDGKLVSPPAGKNTAKFGLQRNVTR